MSSHHGLETGNSTLQHLTSHIVSDLTRGHVVLSSLCFCKRTWTISGIAMMELFDFVDIVEIIMWTYIHNSVWSCIYGLNNPLIYWTWIFLTNNGLYNQLCQVRSHEFFASVDIFRDLFMSGLLRKHQKLSQHKHIVLRRYYYLRRNKLSWYHVIYYG